MKILIILTPLFLFLLKAHSINKDSLKLNTNFEINLRVGMLPKVLNNSINGDKPLCLSYGIGFVYSKPIKKTKSLYFDYAFNLERGLLKYNTNDTYNSLPRKTEITNYMNYINIAIGLKYVYILKKNNFLSLSINQSLSYLMIPRQNIKFYQNGLLTDDIKLKINVFENTDIYSFSLPFYPEFSYTKSHKNIGFKMATGLKILTHDGQNIVFSRILPYITLGIFLIKK